MITSRRSQQVKFIEVGQIGNSSHLLQSRLAQTGSSYSKMMMVDTPPFASIRSNHITDISLAILTNPLHQALLEPAGGETCLIFELGKYIGRR